MFAQGEDSDLTPNAAGVRPGPLRAANFDLNFGKAQVFYPEAPDEKCTAALLLEIDPAGWYDGRAATTARWRNTSTTGLK